jgi:hypothetical protein
MNELREKKKRKENWIGAGILKGKNKPWSNKFGKEAASQKAPGTRASNKSKEKSMWPLMNSLPLSLFNGEAKSKHEGSLCNKGDTIPEHCRKCLKVFKFDEPWLLLPTSSISGGPNDAMTTT